MNTDKFIGVAMRQLSDEELDDVLRIARRRVDRTLARVRRPEAAAGVVGSPLGDLLVAVTDRGVALIHYLSNGAEMAATLDRARVQLDLVEDRRLIGEVGVEIRRYLAGEGKALRRSIDLSLAAGGFQQRVLRKLMEVPRGAVIGYQALGAAAGVPRGARAVGNAMHDNPVPIYVPCHRVIASNGGLGGYGGGALRKLRLLRSEGFPLGDQDVKLPASSVWGHRRTKIYCRPACRTASRADRSRILFFADAKVATAAGLRPCRLCRPEQLRQ